MAWKLEYHTDVYKKDLPKIGTSEQKRILNAIETKLLFDPVKYSKPLRYSLKQYRVLRVGNYRIVFKLEQRKQIVYILAIKHRSKIYKS